MLEGFLAMVPKGVAVTGIVSAPTAAKQTHEGIQYFVGGHPTQNQDSLVAGQGALKLLRGCSRETLVVVLLSGGGSALMESQLLPSLTLPEVQQLNRALVTCGASIAEVNTIRKHVSAVKGGRLAQAAAPATVITLAISDVPVGKESALASGPTLPDPTTCDEVADILTKYDLRASTGFASRLDRQWEDAGDAEIQRAMFRTHSISAGAGMHELFHAAHRIANPKIAWHIAITPLTIGPSKRPPMRFLRSCRNCALRLHTNPWR
jgi:hydroxypyruvate reductase